MTFSGGFEPVCTWLSVGFVVVVVLVSTETLALIQKREKRKEKRDKKREKRKEERREKREKKREKRKR